MLRDMNRGYDVDTYMGLIERARSRMPDICFIGDMIVGFPNETDEDFERSLDLLRRVRYKNVFVFKYSPRPDTVAIKRFVDNVPPEVKKERNNRMLEVQNEIALTHHQAMVNKDFTILCEGESKLDMESSSSFIQLRSAKDTRINLMGRTTGDHIVHFRGDRNLIGTLPRVRITKARQLSLDGVLLE